MLSLLSLDLVHSWEAQQLWVSVPCFHSMTNWELCKCHTEVYFRTLLLEPYNISESFLGDQTPSRSF